MEIAIINGPNLNLTGIREPEIYGKKGFEDLLVSLESEFPGVKFSYFQSNVEGELINQIQAKGFDENIHGIVLNAGGYSHTSVAIADAIRSIPKTTVAVHISNIYNREEFRHLDLIARSCRGVIAGLGLDGYRLAVRFLLS